MEKNNSKGVCMTRSQFWMYICSFLIITTFAISYIMIKTAQELTVIVVVVTPEPRSLEPVYKQRGTHIIPVSSAAKKNLFDNKTVYSVYKLSSSQESELNKHLDHINTMPFVTGYLYRYVN